MLHPICSKNTKRVSIFRFFKRYKILKQYVKEISSNKVGCMHFVRKEIIEFWAQLLFRRYQILSYSSSRTLLKDNYTHRHHLRSSFCNHGLFLGRLNSQLKFRSQPFVCSKVCSHRGINLISELVVTVSPGRLTSEWYYNSKFPGFRELHDTSNSLFSSISDIQVIRWINKRLDTFVNASLLWSQICMCG